MTNQEIVKAVIDRTKNYDAVFRFYPGLIDGVEGWHGEIDKVASKPENREKLIECGCPATLCALLTDQEPTRVFTDFTRLFTHDFIWRIRTDNSLIGEMEQKLPSYISFINRKKD